jgi:stage II sporulation protein AA (anti-sigma F factor antagonist)
LELPIPTANTTVLFLYYQHNLKGDDNLRFTSFLESGQLTVALTGEIDHHCAKEYIQTIIAKIEAYTPKVCILDFRDVTFMDSSGIAVVINAMRNMTRIDGSLILTGLNDQPMKVFRASGIDKLIEIKEAV